MVGMAVKVCLEGRVSAADVELVAQLARRYAVSSGFGVRVDRDVEGAVGGVVVMVEPPCVDEECVAGVLAGAVEVLSGLAGGEGR